MNKIYTALPLVITLLFNSCTPMIKENISSQHIVAEESPRTPVNFIFEEIDPYYDARLYSLQVSDFPADIKVKIKLIRLDALFQQAIARTSSDGTLVDAKGKKALIGLGLYGYGEPITISIQPYSCKGRMKKYRKMEVKDIYIPNPLEVKDAQGHKASIIAADVAGKTFLLMLEGYKPFERVHALSRSCEENLDFFVKTEANGAAVISYAPAVIGKIEGPFELTLQGDDSSLSLQHYWGEITFTPPEKYPALKSKFPTFFQG